MPWPDNHLYEFGPFVLDARSRILFRDGATVHLPPKAFDTLLVLVQHGVQVVDKEHLLKEVWPDTFVEEGSLSRNIHELRKALGDDTSQPSYIETIPKRGYRFLAPLKVSDIAQIAPASVSAEATVIEKHTFARVLTEEFEESEAPSPAMLPPARVTSRRTKTMVLVASAVLALLLVGGIKAVLYLKR